MDLPAFVDWMLAGRFTVLTGAGISTAAGLPTFRGEGGWWTEDSVDASSRETLYDDPARAWAWYAERLALCEGARPTRAHLLLRQLEAAGYVEGVITQNVDRLHERAGSTTIALHGTLADARCTYCDWTGRSVEVIAAGVFRCSACGQPLRPAIVAFGEAVEEERWATALEWTGVGRLLVVGTSLPFPPANTLPTRVRAAGGSVVVVDPAADDRPWASATLTMPAEAWAERTAAELHRRFG